MKKNLLLMMMCVPILLAAQNGNGVIVSELAVDAGTVTFNVSWKNTGMPSLWSDTVWVFVDYNNAGKMERLPLLSGATLTATSPGGKVIEEPDNNKGVWVAGNARTEGSFSATVQLLTAIKDVGGACVYGSNYPPVGEYSKNYASEIKFTGTPQYDVVLLHESGNLATTTTNSPLNVPASYTVHSFTDKTAAPGKLSCIPSTVYDLTASASSFCAGSAGVTFALSGTELGRIYQLYKDGTTVMAALPGTGSPATFSGMVNEVGIYTARAVALLEYCPAVMTGSHAVASAPSPEPPALDGSSSYCTSGTITATAGYDGTGIRWDNGSTDELRTVSVSGTYSAVATSAAGCSSGATSVTVTVIQPGFANNPATACNCAEGLTVCDGTCLASCRTCLQPEPITEMFFDGAWPIHYHNLRRKCLELGEGWRLPTVRELLCLCNNRQLVSYDLRNVGLWSSEVGPDDSGKDIYQWVDWNTCAVVSAYAWEGLKALCVK
jgi:hypothetical protein